MNEGSPKPTLTPVRPKLGIRDRKDLFNATRIGGVSESYPQRKSLLQKLLAIPAAGAAIIGACGGDAVPPTSSTEIVSTTTTPTTLPPTSTTEAPATTISTVAETIPTTLPADITEPTGQVKLNRELIGVGEIFKFKEYQFYDEFNFAPRLINVYIKTVDDFQGKPQVVLSLDVVTGKLTNGDPKIIHVMIGRPNIDTIERREYRSSDLELGLRSVDVVSPISQDLIDELKTRAENNSQIGLIIRTNIDSTYASGCFDASPEQKTNCELFLEGYENIENNDLLFNILRNPSTLTLDDLPDSSIIWASGVHLFISEIPFSTEN